MQSFFEQRGGTYTEVGNVLLPNLVMDEQPEGEIGVWGWRRKLYLKEYRKGTYNAMLMNGTLTQHLIETNEAALDMRETLVKQKMAQFMHGREPTTLYMTLVLVEDNNIVLSVDNTAYTVKSTRCFRADYFDTMFLQHVLHISYGVIA